MGGLWKGEMEKRETERKERERGSCVCVWGGASPTTKKKERDRECYLRKIER